ncbi:MAG: hypothetical protein HWN66_11375 [Candidatus Helarchaeota archaeon]|nr:hypothetical protein [Candidatus Helarchaeota archaeon]
MAKYMVQEGKWEEFFNFELADLIYSRKKSHTLTDSVDYPPDKKLTLMMASLDQREI